MSTHSLSIAKPRQGTVNEDAALARPTVIAVADGAGGGGVFADLWARYLLTKIPDSPLRTFEEMDGWIDGIWEPFFNEREHYAKLQDDGMLLEKFYSEGAFATLAAIWNDGGTIRWAAYGDSVAFHYDFGRHELHSSFGRLIDFALPPHLISCKDPLPPEGFGSGEFERTEASAYFVASDALAHCILMMYMIEHKERFNDDLEAAATARHRNAMYVRNAMALPAIGFEKRLRKLLAIRRPGNFGQHLESLLNRHLIALDDYSLASLTP